VAHRRKRSLTGLDQMQAWSEIGASATEANHWLISAARLPHGTHT
jgi:hypothetical protein